MATSLRYDPYAGLFEVTAQSAQGNSKPLRVLNTRKSEEQLRAIGDRDITSLQRGGRMILVAAALALAVSSSSVPDTPIAVPAPQVKRHNFNRYDYAIYGGVVAYRLGDYFTTERVLATGGYEVELPKSFVETKAGFMAYSLGMAALEIGSSIYLHKHGHAKLARFADALNIAAGGATDLHNVTQIRSK
jgi:hypothetical protein